MKRLLLLFITVITVLESYGQVAPVTPGYYQNLEKYWWYRYRLVNDFMKIGDQCGESIPAQLKAYTWGGDTNPDTMRIIWGDATQSLGHYIATVAAESKLLNLYGWDAERSNKELYLALKAFDRLDMNAEELMNDMAKADPCNILDRKIDNSFNGFFIRDDVKEDLLLNNFRHFNRPGISFEASVIAMQSDFYNRYLDARDPRRWSSPRAPIYAAEESQDQVAEMFLGMAIANRHTDAGLTYNGENIRCLAGNGIFRMINWIPTPRASPHPAVHEAHDIEAALVTATGDYPPDKPWTITNPLTGNCVYGIAMNSYDATFQSWSISSMGMMQSLGLVSTGANQCLDAGACFWLSALPAAQAADICGNSGSGCSNDASALTSDAQHYYKLFQLAQFGNLDIHTDLSFTDDFVAIARNWELAVIPPRPPHYPRNWHWPPSWVTIPVVNTSWKSLLRHSMSNYGYAPHTPLIYRLDKYGTGCGTGFDPHDYAYYKTYTELLDQAPPCGTHNYHGEYGTSWEWSGTNRLLEPTRRANIQNSNFPGNDVWEEYNGLDYTFLFQLYALTETDNYIKKMINPYYTERFSTDYPDAGNLGSQVYKLRLNYLEYLSAINKVNKGGHLTFRGAKVVDLLPGFTAEKGSFFEAFVQDYSCGPYEDLQHSFHYAILTDDGYNTAIEYSPIEKGKTALYHPADDREDHLADSLLTPEIEQAYIDYLLQGIDSMNNGDVNEFRNRQMGGLTRPDGDYMMLSPNPGNGDFKVVFSEAGDYTIEVYNMLGKRLFSTTLSGSDRIDLYLPDLAPGNYTVQAKSIRKNYTKKLTIVH